MHKKIDSFIVQESCYNGLEMKIKRKDLFFFGTVVVPFGSGSLRESGGNHRGLGLGERSS